MTQPKRKDPKCPHCGERSKFFRVTKDSPERIWCPACAKTFDHIAAPKVLVFDIETSQIKFSGFRTGKTVVRSDQIDEDWFILCWSGKWLFQKDTFGACVTPGEARRRSDKRVVKLLRGYMSAADFVVTHNGNRFDIKKVNWRLIYHRLKPVQKYRSIDTLEGIKKVAAPSSLSLDFLAKQLGYGGKLSTSKDLWDRCEAGDAGALDYMYTYNKVDIWKTEDLYAHVKPYLLNHPNFAAFMNMYHDLGPKEHRCPRCIKGVIADEKFTDNYQTPVGFFYRVASCPNCGCMVRKTHRPKLAQQVVVR